MSQRFHLRNSHEINSFVEFATLQAEKGEAITVSIYIPERTISQNTMIYALYADITKQIEDKTLAEVKAECKLHYGIPILRAADPKYSEWYDRSVKPLPYETKLTIVERLPVTSEFNKDQATEYIKTILAEYGKRGIYLPDPHQTPM